LRFESSLSALAPGSPALRAEDRRVREQLGGMDSARLVVSSGDDLQAALRANDGVAVALDAAVVAQELGGFQSLSAWLPSRALQERSVMALRAIPDAKGRLLAAFENGGFEPDAFAHSAFFEAPSVPPLQLSDLRGSPLNEVVRPFLADLRGRPAIVTHLRDVRDPEALRRRLQPLAASVYLDQQALLTALYAELQQRALELTGVGLLAVFAIVWLRYRSLRATLSAMLPALLSGACALSLLALAQVSLNLLHLLGLLLILGIGVDYGIFLLEGNSGSRQWISTLVGIVVACLSTTLSFGLLAISGVPALRALGQMVAIGVPLSLCLAPVARLALMPPEPSDG
jgi:predicted exporter